MTEGGIYTKEAPLISESSVAVTEEKLNFDPGLNTGSREFEVIMMQTRRGESNIFRALMRREMNCRGPDDRNLLLSYAEESTIMSCEQGKVRGNVFSFFE